MGIFVAILVLLVSYLGYCWDRGNRQRATKQRYEGAIKGKDIAYFDYLLNGYRDMNTHLPVYVMNDWVNKNDMDSHFEYSLLKLPGKDDMKVFVKAMYRFGEDRGKPYEVSNEWLKRNGYIRIQDYKGGSL